MTTIGENRKRYSEEVEAAPSRFSNEGKDYAAWAERADKFAEVWADQELIDSLAPGLTCIEAEALSDVLDAAGARVAAAEWINAHARDDDADERKAHGLTPHPISGGRGKKPWGKTLDQPGQSRESSTLTPFSAQAGNTTSRRTRPRTRNT